MFRIGRISFLKCHTTASHSRAKPVNDGIATKLPKTATTQPLKEQDKEAQEPRVKRHRS
jgi:hypothetical protein